MSQSELGRRVNCVWYLTLGAACPGGPQCAAHLISGLSPNSSRRCSMFSYLAARMNSSSLVTVYPVLQLAWETITLYSVASTLKLQLVSCCALLRVSLHLICSSLFLGWCPALPGEWQDWQPGATVYYSDTIVSCDIENMTKLYICERHICFYSQKMFNW